MPDSSCIPATNYQALFETAPALLLVLDREFRIAAVTDAYLRATLTDRHRIVGRHVFEVFPDNPCDPAATGVRNLRKSLNAVLASGQAHTMAVQKYDIPRPNPEEGFEERYWSVRNAPVHGPDGKVRYITHQVEDVTELVRVDGEMARNTPKAHPAPLDAIGPEELVAHIGRLVEARNQLEEQLLQSQKMEAIGRLAGGIAHDFNNLLTVILGYSGILKNSLANDAAYESVDQIEKAAGRASALTRQLLTFSRKQSLQLRLLDLNAVIAGIQEFLQRLIGEDIALTVDLDPLLPLVRADSGQVEQALMNLAANARDAMAGGGRMVISTRAMEFGRAETELLPVEAGRYAVVTVSDTGEGMDATTRSRVFEPFFTTKERGKGTGLGLAMVFSMVEQCGGTITVASEPGRGATFTIFLPSGESEPCGVNCPTGQERRAGTVLLVEDENSLRRLVRGTLSEAGYEVLEARSGEEGLGIARGYEGRIDLLLTDVMMPGMSGPELVAVLRKERPGTIVLFMSGYENEEMDGRSHCLVKPFVPRALVEKVGGLLSRRSASGPRGQ